MKFCTYLRDPVQLECLANTSLREVIVEHSLLSQLGGLPTPELIALTKQLKQHGCSVFLQWDRLMTEPEFQECLRVLEALRSLPFDAIRVQDTGAAEWVRLHKTDTALHLIAESGHHNLASLGQLATHFAPQRIAVSPELPSPQIRECARKVKVPIEVLGLGPLLLYHTPRKLLPSKPDTGTVQSLRPPEQLQQNPVVESPHGTFLFDRRDLFLLDLLEQLEAAGVSSIRVDLRLKYDFSIIEKIDDAVRTPDSSKRKTLKRVWPQPTTHGFFRANRTDRAFRYLNNPHLRPTSSPPIGTVLEANRTSGIVIMAHESFQEGEPLSCVTPQGQTVSLTTTPLVDLEQAPLQAASPGGLYRLPPAKHVTPQAQVFRGTPEMHLVNSTVEG
ncbi:MAG: U32 family peptidase [SAR324 cluster bacterium]|nr:U32 family peptidase [SAR324 cluster bacterium]